MQDLKITLIQAEQIWENKQRNLENYEQLLKNVQNTDLILFPEMFHTGFTMNSEEFAEEMHSSLGIKWLKNIAQIKNTACYTSLIIKENNCFYNRGVFVDETGTITTYDKRKLFGLAGENNYFTAGHSESIVEYKGWKINLQICYDLRFPENCRNFEINNQAQYDLLLYVANWPEKRIGHWKTLLPARAIENQCYVAAVNRIGSDDNGHNYTGESVIHNMNGEVISNHSTNQSIIEASLRVDDLVASRKSLPFLKDYTDNKG
jgi:predicted amidohydrolase